MPSTDAYLAAYPRCRTRDSARTGLTRLAAKPWVQEYLRQHRAEVVARITSEVIASRRETLEFLTAVIRTPAGAVDALSSLCQQFKETPRVKQIRMPKKLRAVARVCEMMGWTAQDHCEKEDPLMDLLERIRATKPQSTAAPK